MGGRAIRNVPLPPGARRERPSPPLPLDHVHGMFCRDQCMARHTTPCGQIRGSSRVSCDHFQRLSGRHSVQTEMKLENELSASHLTSIPSFFHDRPFLLRATPPLRPRARGGGDLPDPPADAADIRLKAGRIQSLRSPRVKPHPVRCRFGPGNGEDSRLPRHLRRSKDDSPSEAC